MHVAKIERRHGERVYTYWLVRRSVREGKRVRHETVANVSKLPAAAIEALRRALAGEALAAAGEVFTTERSLPHECRPIVLPCIPVEMKFQFVGGTRGDVSPRDDFRSADRVRTGVERRVDGVVRVARRERRIQDAGGWLRDRRRCIQK